jgi:hypothetical protein
LVPRVTRVTAAAVAEGDRCCRGSPSREKNNFSHPERSRALRHGDELARSCVVYPFR